MPDPDALIPPAAAALILGVKINTLARWRRFGEGPAYVELGGRIRYRHSDIEAWLNSRTVTPSGTNA
jgi:predicted site-specific integrase-resolvase